MAFYEEPLFLFLHHHLFAEKKLGDFLWAFLFLRHEGKRVFEETAHSALAIQRIEGP